MAASGNGAGIGPGIRSNGTGAGTRHRYRDERSLRCTFDTACPAAPHAIHAEVLPGALVGSQLTQTATLAPAGPPSQRRSGRRAHTFESFDKSTLRDTICRS